MSKAEEKPKLKSNPLTLPVAEMVPHPMLERVLTVDETAAWLAKHHGGDPRRKELADALEEDWHAMASEYQAGGVLEPVKVCQNRDGYRPKGWPKKAKPPQFLIGDGRHRWKGAKEGGAEMIPAVVVSEEALRKVMLGSVNGRRHWTKGMRAYFAVVTHPEVAGGKPGRPSVSKNDTECHLSEWPKATDLSDEEKERLRWIVYTSVQDGLGEIRRLKESGTDRDLAILQVALVEERDEGQNRASLVKPLDAAVKAVAAKVITETTPIVSAESLAEKFGVSRPLINQAVEVYRELDGKEKLRARIEPMIWAGTGLGQVLSGIGGSKATKQQERRPSSPSTARAAVKSWVSRLQRFDDWSEEERAVFHDDIKAAFEEVPEGAVEVIAEALKEAKK